MLSFKSGTIILALILSINATTNTPMDKQICRSNVSFPKVFNQNHTYDSSPLHIPNMTICSGITRSCCKTPEFNDLRHYWETQNAEQGFSKDQRVYSDSMFNIMHKYRETFESHARKIGQLGDLSDRTKTAVKNINEKSFTQAAWIALTKAAEPCWQINATFIKGIMCSMCSPEESLRIYKDTIKFDMREAAQFGKYCTTYLTSLSPFAEFLQDIFQVVRYGSDMKLDKNVSKLDFITFFNSDKEFTSTQMQANFSHCQEISDDYGRKSINPNDQCKVVATKYMGIGPLTKFDQRMLDDLKSLEAYQAKLFHSSKVNNSERVLHDETERLLETEEFENKAERDRRLGGTTATWNPIDGIEQIFWKNDKQFKSSYMEDDLWELPLFELGDQKSSNLKGFDIKSYQMFTALDKNCPIASEFGGELSGAINTRWEAEKICPVTKMSCCTEKYYTDAESKWLKESEQYVTQHQILKELWDLFSQFLLKADDPLDKSSNRTKLGVIIDEIQSQKECDEVCKVSGTLLKAHIIRDKYNAAIQKYTIANAKCSNYILQKARGMRCAVCSIKHSEFFDKKAKEIKMSSDSCKKLASHCAEAKWFEGRKLQGIFKSQIVLAPIKDPSQKDLNYHTFDNMKPQDWLSYDEAESCKVVFEQSGMDLNKPMNLDVGRSQNCIKLCMNLAQSVTNPKPYVIDPKLFELMKIVYGIFGTADDQENLKQLKDRSEQTEDGLPQDYSKYSWKTVYSPNIGLNLDPFDETKENGLEEKHVTIPKLTGQKYD